MSAINKSLLESFDDFDAKLENHVSLHAETVVDALNRRFPRKVLSEARRGPRSLK